MLLNLKEQITDIVNVNYRKETKGADNTLAADVKFKMSVPISILHDMSVEQPPIPFAEFFYHPPEPVEDDMLEQSNSLRRELCISSLGLSIQFFEHSLKIRAEGEHVPAIEFEGVNINQLAVVIEGNRYITLTGRMQFELPDDDELIGRLAEFIKLRALVDISAPKQQDFLDLKNDELSEGAI